MASHGVHLDTDEDEEGLSMGVIGDRRECAKALEKPSSATQIVLKRNS